MSSYHFSFDLRYYPSYQGFEGSKSGASVFRPSLNESLRYANLTIISVHKHPVVSQITLTYKDLAVVTARLNFDSPLVEWDVKLSPIPVGDKQGKEVTVNFKVLQFDNMDIFYTDQSGLEMANRMLGRRWNNEYYPTSHFNISANYYPITNAIAIRDFGDNLNDQLTIIVDRTVGGSVI